ncbi:MAG: tetratricopeptide repeat protein [Snowella sp.]
MNNVFKTLTFIFLITCGLSTPSLSQNAPVHAILETKGTVLVNNKNWKKPQTAFVGLSLNSDDTLDVPAKASVKIYCSDLSIWIVKPGKYRVSQGCPSGKTVILLPNSNNRTLRPIGKTEAALAKLPYVITPRETDIISDRPQIRWNAVPGVVNYTVKIDDINWEKKTDKTEIIYDGDRPLQPETRYWVTVTTDQGLSSQQDTEVGFNVSDQQTKKTVLNAVEKIQKQPLLPTEKGLVLAYLYRGYKLYGDAINVLEELVNQGSREITVYQLLGDTYLEVGLPQLAKNIYKKGLELAIKTKNIPAQMIMNKGLSSFAY